MKLFTKSISKNLYRSALIVTMASFAVGCGSSSTDDTVGITEPDDTVPDTDSENTTETLVEDKYSLDASWSNNSEISVGSYASSSYTKGIQRIIYCLGSHEDSETSIVAFSDGIFGPNTKAAVEEFQGNRGIAVDGIVGPQTWGALQQVVEIDPAVDTDDGYKAFSINGNDCGFEAQFYQNQSGDFPWRMAKTPGSDTKVQFSINGPDEE